MEYFAIYTKREFVHQDKKQTKWYRVGTLKVTEKGGKYIRLFHMPDMTFYVLNQNTESENDQGSEEQTD